MSKQLQLKIVTPEKLILDEMVNGVVVPTLEGELTILPDHIPIIAGITSGDIVAISNGEYVPMAVVGGFLEVKKDEKDNTIVAILADFVEHIGDITEEEIAKAKAKAEELRELAKKGDIVDFEHFESELARSLTRVKIADKWRKRKYRR